ncbi:hypothetical protein [Curtobacterium ammoniigenes]|uniref:hypothetical protein n=1 Tax=Curtobacterium ammoniigenes TaxID=395387 RepID=UPI0008375377|nr:hypothetical protein [Curtobacterium ammoniigenes]
MPTILDTRLARAEQFITAATDVHDGRYDYSQVPAEYVNVKTPVTIICPEHGPFRQAPQDHRRTGSYVNGYYRQSQSCPECSCRKNSSPDTRRAQFVDRAVALHGDRFDYDAVVFVDQHTPVTIHCRAHGAFQQRPTNHLAAATAEHCPSCARRAMSVSVTAAVASGRLTVPQRTQRRRRRSVR